MADTIDAEHALAGLSNRSAQDVGCRGRDGSGCAVRESHHEQQRAASAREARRGQKLPEERVQRGDHPHLARQHSPEMLQCVAVPSGTGKSHLLEALGHEAVDRHLQVAWFSVEDLGAIVRRHRVDDTVSKAFSQLAQTALVLVDDIGLLPISSDAAEGLYRLVDALYERRSVALSSNLHPSGFDQLMDKTIASALVDRLLHHAHVIVTEGESVRLADATSGKGVAPLS